MALIGQTKIQATNSVLQHLIDMNIQADTVQVTEITQPIVKGYIAVGDITQQLAQMVYDSSYINDSITNETSRVDDLNSSSRTNIYKIRQMTMTDTYNANYYAFVTNIIVFTCFVTMLCLSIGAALRTNVLQSVNIAFLCIFIILAIYAIGMMFAFSAMKARMPNDWNQYYHRPSSTLIAATNTKVPS